jgi:hypothetical protein
MNCAGKGERMKQDEEVKNRKVLDINRDWERIKKEQLTHKPENEREAYLNALLRMAAYN